MKSLLLALSVAVGATSLGLASFDAEARRFGGGKPAGMQRQMPAKPVNPTPATPAQPTAPAVAPAAAGATGAAAAAGKRSWMGPIAGLAAGLGIAALFSHLGMGEGLANFMMLALLAVAAVFAIRFVMGRMRGGAGRTGPGQLGMAGAGAGAGGASASGMNRAPVDERPAAAMQREALSDTQTATAPAAGMASAAGVAPAAAPVLPAGMDAADFTRLAKQVFIRMQAANDAADVNDLRRFTTPELFASLRADLLERGQAKQQTDVVQLDAEVVDVAQDDGRDVVSVRFHGLIREQADAGAEPFNELWHLVRPMQGGDWAIAGITPLT